MWPTVTTISLALKLVFVTETVRVPEPVYQRATEQAERKDLSRGAIIQQWMEKAEQYEEAQGRQY